MSVFWTITTLLSIFCIKEHETKNVLFIVVDDLRPDLGCYNGADSPASDPPIYSPYIDKLASQSLLLKRAHVQQALCSPSRTSFLTSRRPDTTLVYDLHTYFRDVSGNFTTIPQYFKDNGYVSIGIGKIFHKSEVSGNEDIAYSWSVPYRRPASSHWERNIKSHNFISDEDINRDPLVDMKIARLAKRALRNFARDGKYQNKPFFLAVGFIRPHLPFVAPSSYKNHYPADDINLPHVPYPPVGMPDIAWNPYIELMRYKDIAKLNASGLPNTTLPDNVVLDLRQAYYSAVSYIDAMVGSVLDELDRLGLSDDTVVSLVGDHGYELGEHGLWCKHTNFELASHAPMMFKIPGLTDKGIVSENIVEFVDIFPTLVEASGLPKLTACPDGSKYVATCTEGQSLMPLISSPHMPWKNTAFSQYPRQNGPYEIMGYSIRTDKYRYTEWPEFSYSTHTPDWTKLHGAELYDHMIDPDEDINRDSNPGYDAIKRQLRTMLRAGWRAAGQAVDTITVG